MCPQSIHAVAISHISFILQTNIVVDQKDLEHAIMVVVSSPWGDVYCGMLNGDIASYDVNVSSVCF